MARFGQDDRILGMNVEEDKFLRDTACDVIATYITHPLLTAKTLMQLGYEPFPLTMVFCMKRNKDIEVSYYLANIFSYAKQLAESHPSGWSVLMTGFDSAALALIVKQYTKRWTTKYLDAFFPQFGGNADHLGEDERRLTDVQSFRRALRAAIRTSTARIVAVIAARPLTVVFIRQIAQLIGGEVKNANADLGLREMIIEEGIGGALSWIKRAVGIREIAHVVGGEAKYLGVWQSVRLILTEEGLAGLFSGIMPQLLGSLLMIWSCTAISFVAERALTRMRIDENEDKEKVEKDYKRAQRLIRFFTPFLAPSLHPYRVASTVMACAGSGLVVSFLPYNPTFNNWQDAYEFFRPHRLSRAADFYRRPTGVISLSQIFASNKRYENFDFG